MVRNRVVIKNYKNQGENLMKKNVMQKITVFLLIAVICGAIMPELNVTAGEMEADPMATDEMRTDSLAAGEAQTDPMATDEVKLDALQIGEMESGTIDTNEIEAGGTNAAETEETSSDTAGQPEGLPDEKLLNEAEELPDEKLLNEAEERTGIYEREDGLALNWAEPEKCHVYAAGDGSVQVIYSVLDGTRQSLMIDTFAADGTQKSHKKLDLPGRSWGGTIYEGNDGCYYIMTGNDDNYAYYIQKYSREWNLLGTASITREDSYTSEAFRAGNSSFTMAGHNLIVHTSRLRPDGHQSNTTFFIDTRTMTPTYITGEFGFDHVSHSFNQFVKSIGNQVLMVDHGDAYPRAVCLQAFDAEMSEEGLKPSNLLEMSLLDIKGNTGNNFTGTTVNGFELGQYNHIVAGSSVPHDSIQTNQDLMSYTNSSRNLYVILVKKDLSGSSIKWLTSYSKDSGISIKNIHLIKADDNKFVLLYGMSKNGVDVSTCCMTIDSNGNILSDSTLNKPFYCTSQPSMAGNRLVWCHYMESELGCFMVKNSWNTSDGSFSVQNLKTGVSGNISNIVLNSRILSRYSVGKKITPEINVYSNAFKKNFPSAPVVWTSSKPSVVAVQNEETILSRVVYNRAYKKAETVLKTKAAGTATITALIGSKSFSFKIKVGKAASKKPKVKKVTLSGKKSVKAGKSLKLKAKVSAPKGANKKLKWKSSNKRYAKVNSKGVVKTYKRGKGKRVKITASATDGSRKKGSIKIRIK